MTKPSFVQSFTELKLPKLDLDALFGVQKANLAVAHEAQTVLVEAAQAIAKVQYGYAQEVAAEVKAVFASKELPKPETVLADAKTAGEKAVAVTKEVVDLATAAQRRVVELLTQRGQANVEEIKAVAA